MWSALICKCKQYRFCWPRPLFCNKRIHDLLNLDPDTRPHLNSNKLHNWLIFVFMHVWSYNTLCWVQSSFPFFFIYLFFYFFICIYGPTAMISSHISLFGSLSFILLSWLVSCFFIVRNCNDWILESTKKNPWYSVALFGIFHKDNQCSNSLSSTCNLNKKKRKKKKKASMVQFRGQMH